MKVDRSPSYVQRIAARLRMLMHAEEAVMRVLVARATGIGPWPVRRATARHIWDHAQTVQAIRERLAELPVSRKPVPWHPSLAALAAHFVDAPDEVSLVAGVVIVSAALGERYRDYLRELITPDLPTKDALAEGLQRADAHAAWARDWLDEQGKTGDTAWAQHLSAMVTALPPARTQQTTPQEQAATDAAIARLNQYPIDKDGKRDPAWRTGSQPEQHFGAIVRELGVAADSRQAQSIRELLQYARELQAADSVVQSMHEVPGMPWEFYYDSARHQWDEVRHYEMGLERLAALGVDLRRLPMPVANMRARGALPPLDRYAVLTLVTEAQRFPSLRKRYDFLLNALEDEPSATLVQYDHGDEIHHVLYGERWVPVMMKLLGETRTVEQILAESFPRYQQLVHEYLLREEPASGAASELAAGAATTAAGAVETEPQGAE